MRSRGLWSGLLTVEAGVSAPLALSGTRTEPHAQALAAPRQVAQAFASWRPAIEQALLSTTSLTQKRSPRVSFRRPPEALPAHCSAGRRLSSHVSLVFVSVTPLSGLLTTTTRIHHHWDDEHTLELGFKQEGSSSSVAVFCPVRTDTLSSSRPTSPLRRQRYLNRSSTPAGRPFFLAVTVLVTLISEKPGIIPNYQ